MSEDSFKKMPAHGNVPPENDAVIPELKKFNSLGHIQCKVGKDVSDQQQIQVFEQLAERSK